MSEIASNAQPIYPDGTATLLELLMDRPDADVRCSLHAGDPAAAVFVLPKAARHDPTTAFRHYASST